MLKNKLSLAVVTAIAAASASLSQAAGIEAASVALGNGVNLTPSINIDNSYDDNVISSPSNEISSWVTVISPTVALSADSGKSKYNASLGVKKGDYHSSEEDNFTDTDLSGDATWEFNDRNRLGVGASWADGHEGRGDGFAANAGQAVTEPDTLVTTDIHADYGFGAASTPAGLNFNIGQKEVDYDGVGTRGRDRTTDYYGVTFNYALAAKTQLIAELSARDVDYKVDGTGVNGTLDSDEVDVLVGVTWQSTAKTSGTIKVGNRDKNFESNARDDYSGARWEVSVDWMPRTYSTFTFTTNADTSESSGVGNLIETTSTGLTWKHEWAEHVSSNVGFNSTKTEYDGDTREDDKDSFIFILHQLFELIHSKCMPDLYQHLSSLVLRILLTCGLQGK